MTRRSKKYFDYQKKSYYATLITALPTGAAIARVKIGPNGTVHFPKAWLKELENKTTVKFINYT